MNDELNKKLAEWAGFCFMDRRKGLLVFPDRTRRPINELPSFTESLDACFKWLVPKVKSMLDTKPTSTEYYKFLLMWIGDIEDKLGHEALSLCLAIEKLIDGVNDD